VEWFIILIFLGYQWCQAKRCSQSNYFTVYIDGLLVKLSNANVGCYVGEVFVGGLAYADDIVLLAPTPSAMRRLLQICDEYAQLGVYRC